MKEKKKEYIGDGVYAEIDMRGLVLTVEDGISVNETIILEPEVWASLTQYGN